MPQNIFNVAQQPSLPSPGKIHVCFTELANYVPDLQLEHNFVPTSHQTKIINKTLCEEKGKLKETLKGLH